MEGLVDWWLTEWKWAFTTLLAVYAAALATYREVQAWRQWRPRLKVRLNLNVFAMLPQGTVPQVQIWIENHGRSDVLFNAATSVGIAVKGIKYTLTFVRPIGNVSFPHTLKPGASFNVMEERTALAQGLHQVGAADSVKLRAVVHDAIGRSFHSAWQRVTPEDFG